MNYFNYSPDPIFKKFYVHLGKLFIEFKEPIINKTIRIGHIVDNIYLDLVFNKSIEQIIELPDHKTNLIIDIDDFHLDLIIDNLNYVDGWEPFQKDIKQVFINSYYNGANANDIVVWGYRTLRINLSKFKDFDIFPHDLPSPVNFRDKSKFKDLDLKISECGNLKNDITLFGLSEINSKLISRILTEEISLIEEQSNEKITLCQRNLGVGNKVKVVIIFLDSELTIQKIKEWNDF